MRRYAFILLVMMTGLLAIADYGHSRAQTPNQVGLVVSYGNGQVASKCVQIAGASASGLDVLQNAGLDLALSYGPVGAAVCKIGNVGCPADNCFCDSPPNNWNYWHLQGASWLYSPLGASNATVNSGAVEGWSWGQSQSAVPPVMSFDQVCTASAAATSEPTQPAPTDTVPAPTVTAVPTQTSIPPTSTALPTGTPLPPTQTPFPPTVSPAPTQTPLPAAPTATEELLVVLQVTPDASPAGTISVALQTDATAVADPTIPTAGSPTAAGSDLTAGALLPDPAAQTGSWMDQGGLPAFGVIVLGLGVVLFIFTRRQRH
jgi:hypothetical protein